jgi:hypothetical protein
MDNINDDEKEERQGDILEDHLKKIFDFGNKLSAHAEATKNILPKPTEPNEDLRNLVFPENLADVTSDELGTYLGWYKALEEYAGYQRACAECDYLTIKQVYDYALTVLTVKMNERVKTRAKAHPVALQLAERKLVLEQKITLLKNFAKTYNGYYTAISREITRRGDEISSRVNDNNIYRRER